MLYYVNITIIFISGKYRKKNKILIILYCTIHDLFIHGHETPNIWKAMVEWEKLLRKCHSRLYTYANWLLLSQLLPSTQPVRQRRVVENSSNCCQCNILNVTRPFVKPVIKHRRSKIVAEYTNKGLDILIRLFEGFVSWIQTCVSILNHVRFNDQALLCAISCSPKRRNKMWNNFVLKSVTVGTYYFR